MSNEALIPFSSMYWKMNMHAAFSRCPPSHVSDCFDGNQPLFSLLEATWLAYFKHVTLLSLNGHITSCGRLSNFFLCLAHSWESARFFVQFSYYATSWVFSRSSARRCFGYYCMQHTKSLFDELATAGWPLSLEDLTSIYFMVFMVSLKTLTFLLMNW